jgi:2-dehydro-3-deoxyphosphogluconate aldolase/(4S)-4-hydroxy-2-oxoglutarate aldolase
LRDRDYDKRAEVCERIKELGIIPAIRVSSAEEAHFAAEPIVEITMTVPEAVELIAHLVRHHQKMIVGAGTVLDTETARRCVDAGAGFLTAPGFNPAIVEFAAKANVAVLTGALTPTEVVTAWSSGSDFVKVFPCAQVGGDKYIKALKTALPGSVDRRRRCKSTDRSEFHLGRSCSDWRRYRVDSDGRHPKNSPTVS